MMMVFHRCRLMMAPGVEATKDALRLGGITDEYAIEGEEQRGFHIRRRPRAVGDSHASSAASWSLDDAIDTAVREERLLALRLLGDRWDDCLLRDKLEHYARSASLGGTAQYLPKSTSPSDRGRAHDFLNKAAAIEAARTLVVLRERIDGKKDHVQWWTRFLDALAERVKLDRVAARGEVILPDTIGFAFVREPTEEKPYALKDKFDVRAELLSRLEQQLLDSPVTRSLLREGPTLLVGPTGSGKTACAQRVSREREGALLHINVSALPENLIESRMRGYKKGAFTDAVKESEGWFEQAHRGTLFLDEFQEAPRWLQAQLLDVLSATSNAVTVSRIGEENTPRVCDVKVVLALNESPEELLLEGRLREDLLQRVRCRVEFGGLRQRLSEFPDDTQDTHQRQSPGLRGTAYLVAALRLLRWKSATLRREATPDTHVRSLFPAITRGTIDQLLAHDWPGNYRELERRAADLFEDMDLGQDTELRVEHLERISPLRPKRATASPQSGKVAAVEEALLSENFVLSRACTHLRDYALGYRSTLKKFVIEYADEFSPAVRQHRKFRLLTTRRDEAQVPHSLGPASK